MYTMTYPSGVLRLNGVVIEQDDRLPEYIAYADWLASGNGPAMVPDDTPARPRIEVSAWQIRKALNRTGLRTAVESWVAASQNQELQDGYYHAPMFWSDHQFSLAAGAALGKDEAWMYDFFLLAKSL